MLARISLTIYTILLRSYPAHVSSRGCVESVSEDAHPGSPRIGGGLWVYNELVWERVLIGGGDGRYVVFVLIYDIHDFEGGFLEGFGHCATDFDDI